MAEDPFTVALESRAPAVLPELLSQDGPESDRPLPRLGLRRIDSAVYERLPDAQERARRVDEVDIAPTEAEDFSTPQTGDTPTLCASSSRS